ncbi:MAG: aminodeoxychorismate lyase [Burkholderiales bacterium]|nr:aminodeoxychorismate lyase [Burkholderiales bacterium]
MILVNGKAQGRIGALDRGLAYGDGVFRTMRACAGTLWYWPRHYLKLAGDCSRIGIDCPSKVELENDIARLLRAMPDCVVKIIVTRGEGGRGYACPENASPTRLVMSFLLPVAPIDAQVRGVRVRWCETRLAAQPRLAGIKHLNRLENVLARREWADTDIVEGLMLDQAGQAVEGTITNLFALEDDALITPSLDKCGVAGVQRDRLLALAPRLGIACAIVALTPERVLAARQLYLVNSVIGLWWVSALGERRWERHALTPELIRLLERPDD